MSPRTPQQLEKIKQEKRLKILNAALKLFASQGFDKTNVDQIAKEAGISKGLIYNYFTSKKEILLTIIETLFAQMDEAFPEVDPEKLTPRDLEQYIRQSMKAIETDGSLLRLYFMLYMQPDIEEIVRPLAEAYIDKIVQFLTPYYRSRGVDNPQPIVRGLIAALDGLSLHYILMQYSDFKDILNIIIKKFVYL